MAEIGYVDEDENNEQNKTSEISCRKPRLDPCEKNSKAVPRVPYYKLFSFADTTDYVLMVVGVITAIGSGLCLPLMTLLFGELANSFGHNVGSKNVVNEVSKVCIHLHIDKDNEY